MTVISEIVNKQITFLLFAILVIITYQHASAFTIDATPQKKEFNSNDWIKVDLVIHGYDGGLIEWVAHRPDNSVISGTVDQQVRSEKTVHQIIRNAYDNEFGLWSINYKYRDNNQTVHFTVTPLNLAVFMDKSTYYEPDVMNINITSSYYNPYAKFAQSYFLNFYDSTGNPVLGASEIEIKADKPRSTYHFPIFQLSKYNPPGLYKLKIQYFNSFVEVPFLLGDIQKFMELSIQNSPTYYQGSDITFNFLFTRLTQTYGTLKITDPSGNVTTTQFQPQSVHDKIVLKNNSKKIGKYEFEIQYAGATNTGTFEVIKNPQELPNIELKISPNKMNFRQGEIANFQIYTSEILTTPISTWVTSPDGNTGRMISLPVDTTETIIPHKIAKNDTKGQWKLYVNYDGIIKYSTFYVDGPPLEDQETLNSVPSVPTFVSWINSTTFNSPTGIAVDFDNNTYVVDSGNFKVKKFDDKGNLLLAWGEEGLSMGQFKNPSGIFVNEKYVYVVDPGNSKINMFNKNGSFVYSWGTYGDNFGMFHIPVSINSDHKGKLFVSDSESNTIQIFNDKGTYAEQIVSPLTEGESFLGLKGLAFDSQNNLFALSTDNKILKYSNIGKFLNFYGSRGTDEGRFNNPLSITIDSRNNIYVADTDNHRIQQFDSNGNFILSFGTQGNGIGQFEQPVSLAIDTADNLYIVDKKNNDVQKFKLYGGINKNIVPSWIKNTTIWWSEGALDKNDFAQAIRYLVNHGMIKSVMYQNDNVKIPNWIKENVKKWSLGQIDDNTFFNSIQYIMSVGIMNI